MSEKTIGVTRVFAGRLIQVDVLEVELPAGRPARREVVRHPGAVAIWAELPDGRFVFVRQFRKAIEQPLLEVVAGTRDRNETAEQCARREIEEETGYQAEILQPLGFIYTAPGFCTERIDIFYARLQPHSHEQRLEDDEALDVILMAKSEFIAALGRNEIHDAKTWAAWGLFQNMKSNKSILIP